MTFALTRSQVRALGPCSERWEHAKSVLPARKKITAAMAREAGCSFNDLVWLAYAIARKDSVVERRIRHWLADCATHVLHIYERDYPTDMRVRRSIQSARDFADGRIDAAAGVDAWAAARAADRRSARAAALAAAGVDAWSAALAVAGVDAWSAARAAEEQWQFDRLILWLSENEPEPFPLPAIVVEKAA